MKKIIITIVVTFILNSCNSAKNKSFKESNLIDEKIVYILPHKVNILLTKKIKEFDTDITLTMGSFRENQYLIYVNKINNEKQNIFFKNTNRVIFINNEFYNLQFLFDEKFATNDTKKEFLENITDESILIKKRITMRHNVYHIIFDDKGKIIYEGF